MSFQIVITAVGVSDQKLKADAVLFDVNGSMGQDGNGGLVSDEAIRAAGEAKRVLSRIRFG